MLMREVTKTLEEGVSDAGDYISQTVVGAAKGLGWFVDDVVEQLTETANWVYDYLAGGHSRQTTLLVAMKLANRLIKQNNAFLGNQPLTDTATLIQEDAKAIVAIRDRLYRAAGQSGLKFIVEYEQAKKSGTQAEVAAKWKMFIMANIITMAAPTSHAKKLKTLNPSNVHRPGSGRAKPPMSAPPRATASTAQTPKKSAITAKSTIPEKAAAPKSSNVAKEVKKIPPTPLAGLHNQQWDSVDVKRDSFKTLRPVDMDNLSVEDATARKALKQQGRSDEQIEQLLSSGDNFANKKLKLGDKLYGFDSQSNKYGAKKQASMYWVDEAGFQDIKSKYYNNGQWDKEGVKNYLALPCMNRADVIDVAEVTQPQQAIVSTVGIAREQIAYTEANYTTGMLGKIMPGGGTQITPNPAKTSTVTRLTGTP